MHKNSSEKIPCKRTIKDYFKTEELEGEQLASLLTNTASRTFKKLKQASNYPSEAHQLEVNREPVKMSRSERFIDKILKTPDFKDFNDFPSLEELKQYDADGQKILHLLFNLCEGFYYDENYCRQVAARLAYLSHQCNIEINKPIREKKNILFQALETKRNLVVRHLILAKKIDLRSQNTFGDTPLNAAIAQGHFPTIEVLIDAGLDPQEAHSCAKKQGKTEIMHLITQKYPHKLGEAQNLNNIFPEIWFDAIKCSNSEQVRELVDKIDINVVESRGWTALHYACYQGDDEIVALLFQQPNLKMDQCNKKGKKPIVYALQAENFSAAIIQLFLDHAFDWNETYTFSLFLRHHLSQGEHEYTFKGAHLLHIMAFRGEYKIVKRILKSGKVDINVPDLERNTVLHHAVYGYQIRSERFEEISTDVIELLISRPDINLDRTVVDLSSDSYIKSLIQTKIAEHEKNSFFYQNPQGRFRVQDFKVYYGSRYPNKKVEVARDEHHELLRLRGLFAQNEGKKGNYLTASLTFIAICPPFEAIEERRRVKFSIDVTPPRESTHISHVVKPKQFLEHILLRFDAAPSEVKKEVSEEWKSYQCKKPEVDPSSRPLINKIKK